MTEQDEDAALRPAWRRRTGQPETPEPEQPPAAEPPPPPAEAAPDTDADLERGRTVALIAALGRLQMSVDLLARQQRKQHDALVERLDRLERALYEEEPEG